MDKMRAKNTPISNLDCLSNDPKSIYQNTEANLIINKDRLLFNKKKIDPEGAQALSEIDEFEKQNCKK